MKPLRVCVLLSLLVVALVFSYYLGQPSYWDSVIQAQDAAAQVSVSSSAHPIVGNSDRTELGQKQHGASLPLPQSIGEKQEVNDQDVQDDEEENVKKKKKQKEQKEQNLKQASGDDDDDVQKETSPASSESKQNDDRKELDNNGKREEEEEEEEAFAAAAAVEKDADQHSKPGENGESHFDQYPVLKQPIWSVPAELGTKMPPLDAFILSKAMIEVRAKKNVIVVTFANFAFMDFVLNWVKHLTEYEVSNILVGAMDLKLLEALFWKGVPVFDMRSNMSMIDVGWGTPIFHKMGREKVILVNAFLSFGYELLMCDTDMVFLQNPLPYFERFPSADVLTSSDEVVNSVDDDSLEIWDRTWGAYNIGIVYWRPTFPAKILAKEWLKLLLGDDRIWDQNGFNELLRSNKTGPAVDNTSGLFYARHGELKLGILPVSLFCSGHTFFVQELYKKLSLQPYAVHTTFQFGGTEGKRHRLREAKHFYDLPEYYDTPGGYIVFNSSIPKELLNGGSHTVASHFKLVNYQLVQIRTAFAIALLLNRTLIMPSMWCRFDRMWYGHKGILDGTKTSQPFLCPLDHVFDINQMLADLDELEFGPGIGFREYSFLENPRVPHEVKTSILKVELCNENKDCSSEKASISLGVLKLPKNKTEDQLVKAFDGYEHFKIFQFSTTEEAFGGFSDIVQEAKFKQRIKTYPGIWCCVMDKTPGHIYYDIYWDHKPNWKPLPPATREDDHKPR
ncbi:hypothetical protein CY35_14G004100 [Sphagnum magellanicum]|nr:hypothetical protein CY35_14G004100 [Sphagnum magellanicum]